MALVDWFHANLDSGFQSALSRTAREHSPVVAVGIYRAKPLPAGDRCKLHRCGCKRRSDHVWAKPGAILARTEVAVLPDDTAATPAIRVLLQEHVIYPRAIAGLLAQLHLQHDETGLNPN